MNKELLLSGLLLLGGMSWSAHAGATPPQEGDSVRMTASGKSYSCEGIVLTYDGSDYDIREAVPIANSIMTCSAAGRHIVVNGHVGPMGGAYLIFDTETKKFEKEFCGANLIWRDADLNTAVYSSGTDIYAYDGSLLASLDLPDNAFIRALSFAENPAHLNVTIELPDSTQTLTVPVRSAAK